MVDIKGCTVTIDAMGTQVKIAKQIINAGGDYLLALKGNQSSLFYEIKNYFDQAEEVGFEGVPHDSYHATKRGHGWLKERSVYVTDDISWLPKKEKWAGLRSLALVISKRTIDGKTTTEKRMYISSLPTDARQIAYSIRSHWGIANQCHWILDTGIRTQSMPSPPCPMGTWQVDLSIQPSDFGGWSQSMALNSHNHP